MIICFYTFCLGPVNYSDPARIIPQSFAYYRIILDITECWKAENIDLKSVRHYLSSYCSDAVVTACAENSYEGLFLAITHEKKPISLVFLEDFAKKIHSDTTIHLIKQYRAMLETSSRYSPVISSDVWLRLEPEISYSPMTLSSGGLSLYRSIPEATSQYSHWTTPKAMMSQYRTTPGVASEYEQRSPKLKKAKLCPYGRSFGY